MESKKFQLDLEQRGRVKTALRIIEAALDQIDEHTPEGVPQFTDDVQMRIERFRRRLRLEKN